MICKGCETDLGSQPEVKICSECGEPVYGAGIAETVEKGKIKSKRNRKKRIVFVTVAVLSVGCVVSCAKGKPNVKEDREYNDAENIEVSDDVTGIEDNALSEDTDLISIEVPEGVVEVDVNAFSGCTNLSSVKLPDSLLSIDISAFRGCTNLSSIIAG